jgi:hypothetical protein
MTLIFLCIIGINLGNSKNIFLLKKQDMLLTLSKNWFKVRSIQKKNALIAKK